MLEHLVDTVLYLEGERYQNIRILRATKNRFGGTDEVGLFNMTELGLKQVDNATLAMLEEKPENTSGSIVTALIEGTRPILVEIQALTNQIAFGYPQRKTNGIDLNRLYVIIAVIEKHLGISLQQFDVLVNVVGGLSTKDPSADLAVLLAIVSSYYNKPISNKTICYGEIGLGGEIRKITSQEKRGNEAKRLGFKEIIEPNQKLKNVKDLTRFFI
jgi:DNA repair protein RadA/Sms